MVKTTRLIAVDMMGARNGAGSVSGGRRGCDLIAAARSRVMMVAALIAVA
jgi:hypothetical protein